MASWIEGILVLHILANLAMLGSSRLAVLIRMTAIQGVLLAALPVLAHHGHLTAHQWGLGFGILVLKGIVFPLLLVRAQREANVVREVEPFVSYTLSIFSGLLALWVSLWLSARLPLPPETPSPMVLPVALFTIFVGLFMIVTRKKALTQVVGYLTLENGIYAFGLGVAQEWPLIVELGILLDIFAAVFVMGITIFHINREFDHIDADRLSTLKDWSQRWQQSPLLGGPVAKAPDESQEAKP